jgi:hypothetical protein
MKALHWLPVLVIFILLGSVLAAQNPAPGWAWVTSPLQKNQQTENLRAATDSYGNVYCHAIVSNLAIFGGTVMDLENPYSFLWKLDASGNTMWVREFSLGSVPVMDMDTDGSGNLYILGANGKITKISPSGYTFWQSDPAGFVSYDAKLRVTADGTCYVAGSFEGTFTFMGSTIQSQGVDILVAKMNSAASWNWLSVARSNGADYVRGLDVDSSGNCYIGGIGNGTLHFGSLSIPFIGSVATVFSAKCASNGSWAWATKLYPDQQTYQYGDVWNVAASPSGTCYVSHYEHSSSGRNFRLTSFNATGTPTALYSSTTIMGEGLETDPSGSLYLYCTYGGSASFGDHTFNSSQGTLLVKFYPTGNVAWAAETAQTRYPGGIFRVNASNEATLVFRLNQCGYFGSFFCSPSSGGSAYVFKMLYDGQILWARTNWINSIRSEARALDTRAEGTLFDELYTYVAGVFEGDTYIGNQWLPNTTPSGTDIYVAKMRAPNDWIWAVSAGGMGIDEVWDLTCASGTVYVTGSFTGIANFGGTILTSQGDSDAFIAALDLNGNWMWAKRAGGPGMDEGRDLHMMSGVWPTFAGTFSGTANFGAHSVTSAGGTDAFLCAMDLNSNFDAVMRFGGPGNDTGKALFTGSNYFWLAGEFANSFYNGGYTFTSAGGTDIYLVRLDTDNTCQWALTGGGLANEELHAMSVDDLANFYLAGCYSGSATFGNNTLHSGGDSDIFVLRAAQQGGWLWSSSGGSSGIDCATAVAVDSNSELFITGWTSGNSNFGQHSYTGFGGKDIMLAGLDRWSGAWQWAKHTGTSGDEYGTAAVYDFIHGLNTAGYYSSGTMFQNYGLASHGLGQSYLGCLSHSVDLLDPVQTPVPLSINSVYPNPFNPSTRLVLALKEPGTVSLDIYNARGQKIRQLLSAYLPAGKHTVLWDGTDESGNPVASGLYLAIAKIGTHQAIRKLMLIK